MPPSMPCVLRYCVLPYLLGLETPLSLAKARQNFKYDIAEKLLSLSPRKREDKRDVSLYLESGTVSLWNLPPILSLALACRMQGCCVAQGGAKQTWAEPQILDCKKLSESYKSEILLPAVPLCQD